MAYALKASGLALKLVSCVLVDDDGATVVDLCGNALDVHANVTIGTTTWKTTSRKYFRTERSGNVAQSVGYATPYPTVAANGEGFCAMVLLAGAQAGSNDSQGTPLIRLKSGGLLRTVTGAGRLRPSSGGSTPPPLGSTILPSDDSTKFSFAGNYRFNQTENQVFYGLESGSLAADSAATTTNEANGDVELYRVGGFSAVTGSSAIRANYLMALVFNDTLTLSEIQSLHNDPWGVLIEAGSVPAAPTVLDATLVTTSTATINWTGGAGATHFDVEIESPAGSGTWMAYGSVVGSVYKLAISFLTPDSTYTPRVRARNLDGDSGWIEGPEFTTLSTAVKKLRVAVNGSAAGATGVDGIVFAAPGDPDDLTGAKFGEFRNQAFSGTLESGDAVLYIPYTEIDNGAALTVDEEMRVVLQNDTHGVPGVHVCTVVED